MSWVANKIYKLWATIDITEIINTGLPAALELLGLQIPLPQQLNVKNTYILDVVQFTSDFEENVIPRASLALPLGRRMDDITQVAAMHTLMNQMKYRLPVSVYLQVKSTAGDGGILDESWPLEADGVTPKTLKIFEGRTVGGGYRKTSQGVDYVLFLTHWLDDMNFTSATSGLFQPLSPTQFSFAASMPNTGNTVGQNLVFATILNKTLTQNVVLTDFWGYKQQLPIPQGGILSWLQFLCNQDFINAFEIENRLGNIPASLRKNTDGLAALNRFEPVVTNGVYDQGVPLNMNPQLTLSATIALKISEDIAKTSFDELSQHTLWDKLNSYARDYSFSIIPMVDRALIVPFDPIFQNQYTVINASEYDYLEINANMPRVLKAAAMMVPFAYTTMSDPNAQGMTAYPPVTTVGGWYQPPDAHGGTVLIKMAPRWLHDNAIASTTASTTVPGAVPLPNVLNPNFTGPPDPNQTAILFQRAKVIWDAFAKAMYAQEILRGRSGQLSGKLRFDIAPGSIVQVEGSSEPFIPGDQLGNDIYARVLRVSTAISSETQQAGTAFHLGYVRSELENQSESTASDGHPMWMTNWLGTYLAKF